MYQYFFNKILTTNVYNIIKETPLDHATNLSLRLKNNIYFKREDLQPIVFSFKIRGAYNKISKLSHKKLNKGIITSSAGNHAQGVALSAKKLNIKSLIIMPTTTPQIKIDGVKKLGSKVILYGDTFSETYKYAINLSKEKNLTFIEPYDDDEVIAGQGTIAMEIIRQCQQKINAIFVPIGGGGLISGIAIYIKNLFPKIKIIGVQTKDSCAMYQSIKQNKIISLNKVGLFSDGTSVKSPGVNNFNICKDLVDEIILVETDNICSAIQDIFNDTRSIAEPAGALSLAGLKKYIEINKPTNKNFISIISGANINFHRLRHVSERTELTEKKEAIFAITIPETPGSFLQFLNTIENRNITEFNYRYGNIDKAHIFVGIQTQGKEDYENIKQIILNKNFELNDLTDDEITKIHVRHMVGGRIFNIENEQVFSFEFPEYPGALHNFLKKMHSNWNITLFHYRNHGSDYGRVLIGINIPKEQNDKFKKFLDSIGYNFIDQTKNIAYKFFLADYT